MSSVWKSFLYQLQQEAPKPAAILCTDRPPDSPSYYGLEYHGRTGRQACEPILCHEGNYLIRQSERAEGYYTLSIRFNMQIKHYRLYYNGQHFVGEKRFDTIHNLVADGLVILYMEDRAGDQLRNIASGSYINSPHYTLTRSMRRHIIKQRHNTYVKEENTKLVIHSDVHPETHSDNCVPSTCDNKVLPISSEISEHTSLVKSKSDETLTDLATQRPHRFNVSTFTGLHWCGFCGHFLWGLVSQGVRCQDCCFKAHKQCSMKVPNDCCPDLRDLQSIFGADLTTCLKGQDSEEKLVPSVVLECVAEIEARGLTVEGIYRVPGSQDQIDALRLAFERDGAKVNISEKAVPDINVVAGLLKLYLRLLPIPLITSECFNQLQGAYKMNNPEARITQIKETLSLLPKSHYSTLHIILGHLARVCEHSAVNKMTATSLSTIFGPTLVQVAAPSQQLKPSDLLALASSAQEPRVIEMLLIYIRDIFV